MDDAPEGVWPKGQVDGSQPLFAHMEELLPCTLAEVPDGFFCNAVSKVDVDPTKGETLPLGAAAVLEGVTRELSVIAVVV